MPAVLAAISLAISIVFLWHSAYAIMHELDTDSAIWHNGDVLLSIAVAWLAGSVSILVYGAPKSDLIKNNGIKLLPILPQEQAKERSLAVESVAFKCPSFQLMK
jgi:hypothetical protein